MLRTALALVVAAGSAGLAATTPTASHAAEAPPVHTLGLSGEGVGMFPAYASDTERYAG